MNKKYKNIIVASSIIVLIFIIYLFSASFSSFIDNGERVAEGSTLTYYIDVTYDGKDSDAVVSSDTAVANVYSDFIFVEDKIPDGLTFTKFVGASNSSEIGAVSKADSSISCPGYVIGGINGLSYDSTTRTVSFKIKNLQAGCKLTVGIETTVDNLGNATHKDFYSVAYATENTFSRYSNTTHTFMGIDSLILHSVTYKYADDSTIPENAPELPDIQSYDPNTEVNLISEPTVSGYTFSGWSASNVEIDSNTQSFTMPDEDVVFVGSFSKTDQYTVTYSLSSDIKPSEYILPDTKEYTAGDYFKVDGLQAGDIINGYRFLGWDLTEISGCVSSNNSDTDNSTICLMPSDNVTITGSFEKVLYKLTYEFRGTTLPSDAASLLPEGGSYNYQDIVTLVDSPTASGYKFLGWSENSTFSMPEKDVVVYGEWATLNGTFSPDISVSYSINGEDYTTTDVIYSYDEIDPKKLLIKTTITNNASYVIKDVMVKNNLDSNVIIESDNYEITNNEYITIPSISAGDTIDILSEISISETTYSTFNIKMDLVSAINDNNYYLDDSAENSASTVVKVSNVKLKVNAVDSSGKALNDYNFVLYKTSDLSDEPLESATLEFNKLDSDITYYLKQTRVTTGYVMSKVITINVSEEGIITADGVELESVDNLTTINVVNNKINLLPQTGGSGNVPFILIGLSIITISAVIYIIYLKKNYKIYV